MTILEKGINLVFYVLFTKPNLTKSVKECPLPIQVWNEMKFDWTNDWYLLSIKMARQLSATRTQCKMSKNKTGCLTQRKSKMQYQEGAL